VQPWTCEGGDYVRICRYTRAHDADAPPDAGVDAAGGRLGLVTDDGIRDVTAALDLLPAHRYPFPRHDLLIAHLDELRPRLEALAAHAVPLSRDAVRLLSPVANPGKIVAAPVNYETHLDEVRADPRLHQGNLAHTVTIASAGLFLKATSSLIGADEGITICQPERRTDHEVELVCVIGRRASRVSRAEALACVAGYAIGLDVTIRGSEDRSLRKSPDTYSVLGPWLVTTDEIPDPDALDLALTVNGEARQAANTRQLILGVAALVVLASRFYTLHPGDLIFTGTPEGVGPIAPGDTIAAVIERIGRMEVRVHG
jgi:2-keto-4-pentenoate hydratase/2-oxohepta-3-ene-1,7-dioic acid hydratase in catechol pathway